MIINYTVDFPIQLLTVLLECVNLACLARVKGLQSLNYLIEAK